MDQTRKSTGRPRADRGQVWAVAQVRPPDPDQVRRAYRRDPLLAAKLVDDYMRERGEAEDRDLARVEQVAPCDGTTYSEDRARLDAKFEQAAEAAARAGRAVHDVLDQCRQIHGVPSNERHRLERRARFERNRNPHTVSALRAPVRREGETMRRRPAARQPRPGARRRSAPTRAGPDDGDPEPAGLAPESSRHNRAGAAP